MRVKVTTLYYLICSLGNILHIYQICDEYFRYDVTTNVQVTVPENIVFPSITLCVDLMDSLNWSALSLDTRRRLIVSRYVPESVASVILKNSSVTLRTMQLIPLKHRPMFRKLFYNQLVDVLTVTEIMNISASIHEVVHNFMTTRLAYNESQHSSFSKQDKELGGLVVLNTTESLEIQFIIDMIYIRQKDKCFTLRLRPELNKIINYDELITKYGSVLFKFESRYDRAVRIYLSSDGHLNRQTDSWLFLSPSQQLIASFVTHNSVLLEYPYKSNCRDYTKNGMLSRHECRYQCFKPLIISRFNRIFEQIYAFESDNLYLRSMEVSKGYILTESMPADIIDECQKTCLRKECRSVSHIHIEKEQKRLPSQLGDACSLNDTRSICMDQQRLEKLSRYVLFLQDNPGTRTETQAAIPLVSFLTGLFSTFGFWLGLSVFGSANFIEILWNKTRKKKKLNCRTQQDAVRIIRQQQPTSHCNSSWRLVKVSSPVHTFSAHLSY